MDLDKLEKIDKLKTKMLKYIFYKKRTEAEVREKFKNEDIDILSDTIENLKELGYINDEKYVDRFMHEAIALKNSSIFELKYKLYSKGIKEETIDKYISENDEMLNQYELLSARNIFNKKKESQSIEEIQAYLYRKRYNPEIIRKISRE